MHAFTLLALAASATGLALQQPDAAVNEVINMVESGLEHSEKEGRALLITLTITEAVTMVSTVSAVLTTNTKCLANAIASCPAAVAAAAAAGRSMEDMVNVAGEPAILTSSTGEKVDVHAIKPTKSIGSGMDVDAIIHENEEPISSGSLSFREVRMENLGTGCGRSDGNHRRPRIVIPSVLSTTKSFTTTTYTSTVFDTTVKFTVPADYCTDSNYPTDSFFATAMVCA